MATCVLIPWHVHILGRGQSYCEPGGAIQYLTKAQTDPHFMTWSWPSAVLNTRIVAPGNMSVTREVFPCGVSGKYSIMSGSTVAAVEWVGGISFGKNRIPDLKWTILSKTWVRSPQTFTEVSIHMTPSNSAKSSWIIVVCAPCHACEVECKAVLK